MPSFVIGSQKWGASALGTPGGQVMWSFATRSYDGYQFDRFFVDEQFKQLVRDAFQVWEDIANIDFVEIADGATSQFRLGWDAIDGAFGTVGEAASQGTSDGTFDPSNPRFSTTGAEIRFDTAETWSKSKTNPGFNETNFFAVAIHEIGHAIGLDHTDDPSTIMFPTLTTQTGLAAGDIQGVQMIYGAGTGQPPTPPTPATLAQLFAANADAANGLSAAYHILLGGVPNEAGYVSLINAAVSTNFGAGPGPTFNTENIFINLTNNLVQGNPAAKARFDAIATGTTLTEKITAIYQALVPPSKQTAEGLAFITRPDGITFYQAVAAERGVAGTDGAAIVAMASLLQTVVSENIGVGNAVRDLAQAIAAGNAALPASGGSFTDIEVADGTAFDADDGAAIARIATAPESAPFIYIDDDGASGPFEPGQALALIGAGADHVEFA